MREDLIGINSDRVDQLVLDIYDYIEKINSILANITNEVNKASTLLDCNISTDLKNKYKEQQDEFIKYSNRLVSYTEKLISVKTGVSDLSLDLTTKVSKDAQTLRDSIQQK